MNQTRTFLMFALLAVAFMLWQAWEQDYAPHPVETPAATTSNTGAGSAPGTTPAYRQ